jgi:hypothetical protein
LIGIVQSFQSFVVASLRSNSFLKLFRIKAEKHGNVTDGSNSVLLDVDIVVGGYEPGFCVFHEHLLQASMNPSVGADIDARRSALELAYIRNGIDDGHIRAYKPNLAHRHCQLAALEEAQEDLAMPVFERLVTVENGPANIGEAGVSLNTRGKCLLIATFQAAT